MKVIIFGASGTVGFEITAKALMNGYDVTAFVRSPEKIATLKHANLSVFVGDVLNESHVENALKNQDAVFCALGDGKVGKIRAPGTKVIINMMEKSGIRRLICQTTLGMGESYGNLNFIWKYIMFGIILRKAFKDHQLQEEYILNSNLDYTIVRPSALTDGAIENNYLTGFDGSFKNLSLNIARKEVADFMLNQLETTKYLRNAVSISY